MMIVFGKKDSWFNRNVWENALINPYATYDYATHGGVSQLQREREAEAKAEIQRQITLKNKTLSQLDKDSEDIKSISVEDNTGTIIKYGIGGVILLSSLVLGMMYIRKKKTK